MLTTFLMAMAIQGHSMTSLQTTESAPGYERSRGEIRGVFLDAATGAPLRRGSARASTGLGRSWSDSAGLFQILNVPAGPLLLEINCPSRTILGRPALTDTLTVRAGLHTAVTIHINPTACAEPDSLARAGVYRGLYRVGFERSEFVVCPRGAADSLFWAPGYFTGGAWLNFADATAPWNQLPPGMAVGDDWVWYLEVSGVLTGPGQFGHLGMSPYLLTVDTVQSVSSRPPSTCPVPTI